MSAEEAENDTRGGDASGFMKYPKAGDNTVRVVDEPDKWVYYWEHYNPSGFPFPCTNDRDTCNGCISDDEKMKKASKKVAMNCWDGNYTNVWKFPNQAVAEKLKARYERYGTITDRDYLIRQYKGSNGFVDYEVEGLDKAPLTKEQVAEFEQHRQDPEPMLKQAWEDAWGDSPRVQEAKSQVAVKKVASRPGPVIQKAEPQAYNEAELRTMDPWDLVAICNKEGLGDIPPNTDTSDEIVDWMLTKS